MFAVFSIMPWANGGSHQDGFDVLCNDGEVDGVVAVHNVFLDVEKVSHDADAGVTLL
jgi:hypothetical protein